MEEKTIIALEIGSSKIKGATGSVGPDGALNVKAVEEEPIADIVRYGCILNVVDTAQAVRNVINRLELRESPRKVEGVYLSLGGRSLSAQSVDIERRLPSESIITQDIIEDITAEALEYPMNDRTIVDVTPRELLIDNRVTPRPIGVMGSHVLARLNLVSCRTQLLRTLSVVIEERLGLKILGTFVRPLAVGELVLLNEEKKLGCMLVDFGAETTTVAIYRGGILVHLAVLPMGSRNITRDITSLNYLEEQAEELKKVGGSAFPTLESSHAPGQPDFVTINNYVSARAAEIIVNIAEQVNYAGLTPDSLPEGIIIVGKGARLNGFNQRLEQLSHMKVRTGAPGNRLRILDGRIQVADSVDVLSILSKAAKNDPKECMTRPVAEQPATVTQRTYPTSAGTTPAGHANPANPGPTATVNVTNPGTTHTNPGAGSQGNSTTVPAGGTTYTAPQNPPRPVSPKSPAAPAAPRKPNLFTRGYNQLVTKVANLITNSFEEEEDEE